MPRLALALAVGASCLLCLGARGDTLLLPIRYADAGEICDMFSGKVVGLARLTMPQGLESIVALREDSALVAQGSADSLDQLRELVSVVDRPSRRIQLGVRAVVPPAGHDLTWRPAAFMMEGGHHIEKLAPIPVESTAEGLKTEGARILQPVGGGTRSVSNNRSTTFWFGDDFVWFREGKPLAVGLQVTPRLNGDNSVTLSWTWVRVALDEKGKPHVQPVPEDTACVFPQVTIGDGESVLTDLVVKDAGPGGGPVCLLIRAVVDLTEPVAP